MIDAVLFDLDGVLVDACEWHYEALNSALLSFGINPINREDHETKYNGLPTKVKLNHLNIHGELAESINQKKQELTLDIIRSNAILMPEKVKLLSFLKNNGIKIACVTNSIQETASAMLSSTGQLEFIDLLVSNEMVTRNKPYPDCYNLAIQNLGVNPINCICVEDSQKGIEAATSSIAGHLWVVKEPSEVTLENYIKRMENEL